MVTQNRHLPYSIAMMRQRRATMWWYRRLHSFDITQRKVEKQPNESNQFVWLGLLGKQTRSNPRAIMRADENPSCQDVSCPVLLNSTQMQLNRPPYLLAALYRSTLSWMLSPSSSSALGSSFSSVTEALKVRNT